MSKGRFGAFRRFYGKRNHRADGQHQATSQSELDEGGKPFPFDSTQTLGYVPALDGIRAIAVLLVMAAHLGFVVLGGMAVDIFFVLSGFLITAVLLSEFAAAGKINLKNFYIRRGLRLLPALILLLLIFNLYSGIFQSRPQAVNTYRFSVNALFYVANWSRAFGFDHPALGHLWSLSIEEQFYLLWPLALVLLLKRKASAGQIAFMIVVVIVVIPLYRFFLWHGIKSYNRVYNGTDTRADSLLIGCALSLLPYRLIPRRLLYAAGVVSAALLAYIMVFNWPLTFMMRVGFTLFALAAAIFLAAVLANPGSILVTLLQLRPLVWTGRLSYSLYLWHFPAFYVVGRAPTLKPVVVLFLKVFVAFSCATLSYYFVEKPCLDLKRRFSPTKGPIPSQRNSTDSSSVKH